MPPHTEPKTEIIKFTPERNQHDYPGQYKDCFEFEGDTYLVFEEPAGPGRR